jgi:DNA-binding response OmpR family regulator
MRTRSPVHRAPPPVLRDSLADYALAGSGARLESWPTLLVVDDDPQMLSTLVCYFERRGFHVAPAATLAEAKSVFSRCKHWTLVISDFHLPDGTGTDLQEWITAQRGAAPPFLVMSGSVGGELKTLGIDYLAKPFAVEDLEKRVRILLRGRKD